MPTLADIYSAIDSAKRRGTDFIQNPGTSLAQMLGNANDRARAFNELNRQAADESIAARDPFANGSANQELLRTVAGAYNPVGMINQPIKGAKLVNIPIDMIEHGEAVMPGGTLTFAGARKKIEEYAKKETPIPPIDVVSGEAGKPWMVADGSHRLEAAKLRGEKTIPAYVSPHDKEGLEQIAKFKMNAKDAIPTEIKDTSYRGSHTAPGPDFGAQLHDLTGGGQMYPADIYSAKAVQYYGGGMPYDQKAISIAQQYKDKPNAMVTIYRAVPKEKSNSEKFADIERNMAAYMRRKTLPQDAHTTNGSQWYEWAHGERERLRNLADEPAGVTSNINPGDWVTLTREYAKDHGESALKGKYKIISKKVKAKDIWTNADSIHEFGYHPE